MTSDEIKNETKKLNIVQIIERGWDQIAESNESMPISDRQKQEIDKRLDAYQKGELKTFEWQAVHDNLRKKYK